MEHFQHMLLLTWLHSHKPFLFTSEVKSARERQCLFIRYIFLLNLVDSLILKLHWSFFGLDKQEKRLKDTQPWHVITLWNFKQLATYISSKHKQYYNTTAVLFLATSQLLVWYLPIL